MLVRLRGGHFATQPYPAQSTLCPPKLEFKLPTSPLGLPSSRQRCFKDPHFQHLLRGKAPRCESGIHLAGSGEKVAICCPVPPLPHPSTRQAWKGGGGWEMEETVLSGC